MAGLKFLVNPTPLISQVLPDLGSIYRIIPYEDDEDDDALPLSLEPSKLDLLYLNDSHLYILPWFELAGHLTSFILLLKKYSSGDFCSYFMHSHLFTPNIFFF